MRQIGLSGTLLVLTPPDLVISCTRKCLHSMCLVFSKPPARPSIASALESVHVLTSTLQPQIRQQRLHSRPFGCPRGAALLRLCHVQRTRRLSPQPVLQHSPTGHRDSSTRGLPSRAFRPIRVFVPGLHPPRHVRHSCPVSHSPLQHISASLCGFRHIGAHVFAPRTVRTP